MARVPYVQREQLTAEQQRHFDAIAGSRGRVGPNFQALLNSPEAGGRFAAFGEYVRFHGDVPERLLETSSTTAAAATWFSRPIWFYLVAFAWALAAGEWFLYQRRWIS